MYRCSVCNLAKIHQQFKFYTNVNQIVNYHRNDLPNLF